MKKMWVLLATVTMWAGFASSTCMAYFAEPVISVSEVVIVSDQETAIIGTATQTLIDSGIAYYEIVDDLGVVDCGYTLISADGSYLVFLSAEREAQIEGIPNVLLYDWDSPPLSEPIQICYMMAGDSVTRSIAQTLATGNSAAIRSLLQVLKGYPGLYEAEIAALEA